MSAAASSPEPVEDILEHIPCSRVLEYKTGAVIYGEDQPVASIFLVIAGVVKVSRLSPAGQKHSEHSAWRSGPLPTVKRTEKPQLSLENKSWKQFAWVPFRL